ncbi:hypothetical protein ACFWMJ_19605 [Streptomyces hawaiiensis]|uniref:hypothetical protein n=1 Tax=Streptomyces hawaiiensis TaxID=67305 RepID=UPI003656CE42
MARRARHTIAALMSTVALAGGAALASGTAVHADEEPPPQAGEMTEVGSNGRCSFGAPWGGKFLCESSVWYKLPNRHNQVFVIGLNNRAYSRWSSPGGGMSAWTELPKKNGFCYHPGQRSMDLAWVGSNKWNFAVTCLAKDKSRWYNERYASGNWSGWRTSKY